MPQIEIVEVMKKQPARCFVCHLTPSENGVPLKAIDLGTDHDWGQWTYLCSECVNVICDLWGRVEEDVHDAVVQQFEDLKDRHERLRARFKEQRTDLDMLAAGESVRQKVKKKKRKKAKS